MREIKFRAWTGATLEYNVTVGKFGGFYVNPGVKGDGLDDKDKACLSPFTTIYPPTTPVMQFTGLKDKNGKEIYEGDIVVWYEYNDNGYKDQLINKRLAVEWQETQARFVVRDTDDFPFDLGNFHREALEIIGNIYENPELLHA